MNPEIKLTNENRVPAGLNHYRRVFGDAKPTTYSDDDLKALATSMTDVANSFHESTIPSGYTYFGQFLNHEIARLNRATVGRPLHEIENLRTPVLDLMTLYGRGPSLDPHLYDADGISLQRGLTTGHRRLAFDLPRRTPGPPLPAIVDERNDENLLVAQIHVLFIKFHNAVVRHFGFTGPTQFQQARDTVVLHFQSVVVHDYLKRITESTTYDSLLARGFEPFGINASNRFLPAEFSFAAFRFGHSMSRPDYILNLRSDPPDKFDLFRMFNFVGFKHFTLCGYQKKDTLPTKWAVDWRLFFDYPRQPGLHQNRALMIAPRLATDLGLVKLGANCSDDTDVFSLAEKDLRVGLATNLTSGQEAAGLIGVAPVPDDALTRMIPTRLSSHFLRHTPLWYYILAEARHFENGERLGLVGSALVAGTIFGLVRAAPLSVLADEAFRAVNGRSTFSMTDLLEFIESIDGPNALQPI